MSRPWFVVLLAAYIHIPLRAKGYDEAGFCKSRIEAKSEDRNQIFSSFIKISPIIVLKIYRSNHIIQIILKVRHLFNFFDGQSQTMCHLSGIHGNLAQVLQ